MGKESSHGLMEVLMMGNLLKTILKEQEFTCGVMAVSTKEPGKIIKWKAWEFSAGQMAESMKENILMIRKKVKELSSGLMDVNMKVNGRMESKTVLESILLQVENKNKDSGLMVKELPGFEDKN